MFDWFRRLCSVLYRRVKNVRRKNQAGLSMGSQGAYTSHRNTTNSATELSCNGDVHPDVISPSDIRRPKEALRKLDRFEIEWRLKQAKKKRRQGHEVGRFMKHGRQARWYRRSVKARVQPEEEND